MYTPPAIAAELVARALPPIVEPLVARGDVEALARLRICDPAIGEGAIAIAIVDYLAAAIERAGRAAPVARAIAERCVVGMDVDARALAVARERVPGAALREGDALVATWEPVDAVIANPPYIRGERIADKAALARFAAYDATADLYVYFLEVAHRIVRPGGRYAIVVPQKWMTAAYGRHVRALLAPTIHGVIDAPDFPDADAFPCIVWGAMAPAVAPATVETRGGARSRAALGADPWHFEAAPARALLDRLARAYPPLESLLGEARPQRGVVTGCNAAFVVDRAVRDALVAAEPANEALVRPLVKGRDLSRARAAHPATAAIVRPLVKGRDLARARAAHPANAAIERPFADARLAERFVLLVDHGTQPTASVLAHLARFRPRLEPGVPGGRKPGKYRWYELQDPLNHMLANPAPRILYQDIQTQPLAALDDGSRVPDTTLWMLPTADPWILAILQSPLYAYYARHRFPPALNGAVRPKWEYLRHLPIAPRPSAVTEAAEATEAAEVGDVADAYALSASERVLVGC